MSTLENPSKKEAQWPSGWVVTAVFVVEKTPISWIGSRSIIRRTEYKIWFYWHGNTSNKTCSGYNTICGICPRRKVDLVHEEILNSVSCGVHDIHRQCGDSLGSHWVSQLLLCVIQNKVLLHFIFYGVIVDCDFIVALVNDGFLLGCSTCFWRHNAPEYFLSCLIRSFNLIMKKIHFVETHQKYRL